MLKKSDDQHFSVSSDLAVTGPWFPVESQTSGDRSSIMLAIPTNRPAQFYRLTK
jgi:hypothetical protein